jgi:hypothetical protein
MGPPMHSHESGCCLHVLHTLGHPLLPWLPVTFGSEQKLHVGVAPSPPLLVRLGGGGSATGALTCGIALAAKPPPPCMYPPIIRGCVAGYPAI